MHRCIYFLSCFFLLLSCGSGPNKIDRKNQVLGLADMSDLATAEYVVTKLIKANDNETWYKTGERKILMSSKATLVAGVDLSQLTENDISIDGNSIELRLPKAKLLYIAINPEDIRTEYEEVSFFRSRFSAEEKNKLAKQAEAQIKNSADSIGVLVTAETNASIFIDDFLKNLGFTNIRIHFSTLSNPLQ